MSEKKRKYIAMTKHAKAKGLGLFMAKFAVKYNKKVRCIYLSVRNYATLYVRQGTFMRDLVRGSIASAAGRVDGMFAREAR